MVTTTRARGDIYHPGRALLEIGRLCCAVVEDYFGWPIRDTMLARLPGSVGRLLAKAAASRDPVLNSHVRVPAPNLARLLRSILLGTRPVRSSRPQATFEIARRTGSWILCNQNDGALHNSGLVESGIPFALRMLTGSTRQGRALLLEELDRWGFEKSQSDHLMPGYTSRQVEANAVELASARVVCAIGEFVKQTLIADGVDASKVIVARLGVDSTRFRPAYRTRAPREKLRLAFVGSDIVRKGLGYALRAASRFGPDRVEIVVYGQNRPEKLLIRDHGDLVRFNGSQSPAGLAAALQTCHAAILPSLWEGYGLAVMEGMACGLPPIVANDFTGDIRCGENGFTTPPRDVDAITQGIEAMFDEPRRQEMARAARLTAEAASWQRHNREFRESLGLPQPPSA